MRHLSRTRLAAVGLGARISAVSAALGAGAGLAFAFAFALAACAGPPPPPTWIAVEPALRAHGVRGVMVVRDDGDALDVRLALDAGDGRFAMRAHDGAVDQQLDEPGGTWRLHSDRALRFMRVESVPGAGAPDAAPGQGGGAALDAALALDADAADAFARIVALDRALAVQGSSLVRGGRAYEPCTVRCDAAGACVARAPRALAACQADVVVCAACLERAP